MRICEFVKRFAGSNGSVPVTINDEQWSADSGGILRALVRGTPGGVIITGGIETIIPTDEVSPVGMFGTCYAEIADCKVEERWRRRGVGTRLVSEVLVRMKLVLPSDTVVYGWVPQFDARAFWERFGFVMVEDANGKTIMQARLSGARVRLSEERAAALVARTIDHGVITSRYGPEEDLEPSRSETCATRRST